MSVWDWAVAATTGAAAGATAVQLQHSWIIRRHIRAIRHLHDDIARLHADLFTLRLQLALPAPDPSARVEKNGGNR